MRSIKKMNTKRESIHIISILQALFVTFIWSASFIIIKWGLVEIHKVIFAGFCYMNAFLVSSHFLQKENILTKLEFNTPDTDRIRIKHY